MSTLRIATFNVENLFARYRFKDSLSPRADDGFTINDLAFTPHDEESKRITARATRATNAGAIYLHEVESQPVLDRFNSYFLGGMRYAHRVVIDCFDPRQIDVAVHPSSRCARTARSATAGAPASCSRAIAWRLN